MKKLIILIALMTLAACSAEIKIGYHGKTGVDNETISPELVNYKRKY